VIMEDIHKVVVILKEATEVTMMTPMMIIMFLLPDIHVVVLQTVTKAEVDQLLGALDAEL
ncbi:MAG: hypothetical protein AAFQ60_17885, partial [Pseudomonadota bacterium]